jgi:hypothetical protein
MDKEYWAILNAMEFLEDLDRSAIPDSWDHHTQYSFYLCLSMLQDAIRDPQGSFPKPSPMYEAHE